MPTDAQPISLVRQIADIRTRLRLMAPPVAKLHTYTKVGAINGASTGARLLHNDTGVHLRVRSVRVTLGTAPTTQAVEVDALVGGVSIFTGALPQVAVGAITGAVVVPTQAWTAGDPLRVDVTQGDTDAADLQVVIAVD